MQPEKPRVTIGALVFNPENKLLLLKSHKWHGKLTLPCGHVEFGEKLEEAVKREVMEETGLKVSDIEFLKILERIQSDEYYKKERHFVCINYNCKTEGKEVKLNEESQEYFWLSPEEALRENLDSITRANIEKYINNSTND